MYVEVCAISLNLISFSLQNIIYNIKSLFLISALFSLSLIIVLWAILNTNQEDALENITILIYLRKRR